MIADLLLLGVFLATAWGVQFGVVALWRWMNTD